MLHDTRKRSGPTAFIETGERVHFPCEVTIESGIVPATETRPRRHGSWQLQARHLSTGASWSRLMEADFDHADRAGFAMVADAEHHSTMIPALAGFHPELSISGLSHESGGYLAGRPRYYEEPVFAGCFPAVRAVSDQQVDRYRSENALAVSAMPPPTAFDCPAVPIKQVKAMVLGVAIGDAMGYASESMQARDRYRRFGWIRDLPRAETSDDTQLTLRTLHALFRNGRIVPADLHAGWTASPIRGIGRTVRAALRDQARLLNGGQDPWAGRVTGGGAGNGSLMRVAGVLAPYALCDPKSVTADLLLASAFTHDDRSANAACLGWGACLLALATRDRIRTADDLFDVFVETASPVEGPRQMQTRSPHIAYTGNLCDFIDQVVRPAHRAPATLARKRDGWYSGAFLLETLPTMLSIVAQHLDDPRAGILEAVNRTWDNDTIGGLVASAMGMRHGTDAFEEQWENRILTDEPAHREDRVSEALDLLDSVSPSYG